MNKVLHVIGSLRMGGSQTFVMNVYQKIQREQIQFGFVLFEDVRTPFEDQIYNLGGEVFRAPAYKGVNHFTFCKWWEDFFKEHPEYHVVHGHVRSIASIYLSIAKQNGCFTIAHSHNISSGKGLAAFTKDVLQYPIRYIADYFMGCSPRANEWLFGKKVAQSSRCQVVNNGIDVDKFVFSPEKRASIRTQLNITDECIVIGNIGRLAKQKNHMFFLEAFAAFKRIHTNSRALIVGDGEEQRRLKEKAEQLGIEKEVFFLGNRLDTDWLYSAMDLFLFPSLYEGLGIVLVEAQAAGLPCVVSNTVPPEAKVSEFYETLDLSVKPDVWAQKCLDIWQETSDRNRTEGYEKIKASGYDIQSVVQTMTDIYKNHLNC